MALTSYHAQAIPNAFTLQVDWLAAVASFVLSAAAALALICLTALLFSIFMGGSSRSVRHLIPCLLLASTITGAWLMLDRLGVTSSLNGVTPIADKIAGWAGLLVWLTVGTAALLGVYAVLRLSSTDSYVRAIAVEQEAIDLAIECIEALLTPMAQASYPRDDTGIGNSNVSVEHLRDAHRALIGMREHTLSGLPLGDESRRVFNAIVRMLNTSFSLIEEHLQAHGPSIGRNRRGAMPWSAIRRASSGAHGRNLHLPELCDIAEPLPALDFMRLFGGWLDDDNEPSSCAGRETTPVQSYQPVQGNCAANVNDWYDDSGASDGGSDSSGGSCSDCD